MSPPDRVRPPAGRARPWLVLGLSLGGLLHIVAAGLSTRVGLVPVSSQFGLLQHLPALAWAGIALVALAAILALRERSEVLVAATGSVLLAVIAGMPGLFESSPRYWDSYLHFGEAQLIAHTGHLPGVNIGLYSANWPGAFLVLAAFSQVAGVPAMTLLTVYPFLAGGLTFVALLTFARSVFPSEVAAPAAILSSLLAVWAQYHVSPQSLGFVMLLVLVAVLWRPEREWRAVGLVLFAGLVVSHPTSTILLLAILSTMCLLGPLRARKHPEAKPEVRALWLLTLVYAGIWFAWLYFHATASFDAAETALLTRMGALVSLPEQTVGLAAGRTAENLFPIASRLRLVALGVFVVLAVVSIPFLRRTPGRPALAWLFPSSVIAIGTIGAADILAFGGQFYDRCLLLLSVLAPGACLTGLRTMRLPRIGRRAVLAVLVAASVAAASTVYYQESFYQVPDTAVALSDFLQRVPPGAAVFDGMYPVPVWIDPGMRATFGRMYFYEAYPQRLDAYIGLAPTYAVFDSTTELWYRQWRGIEIYQSYVSERSDYSRVYDNGRAVVYYVGG